MATPPGNEDKERHVPPSQGFPYPILPQQGGNGVPQSYGPTQPGPQQGPGPYNPPQGPQPGYGQPPPQGSYVGGYAQPQPQPGYVPGPQQQPGYGPGPQPGLAPGPQPVITQPTGPAANNWMHMPHNITPNCPPGLEYLTMIDHLVVHQQVNLMEALSGSESENKYTVHNSVGQKVYNATEISDTCGRNTFGSFRAFHIKILDNYGQVVIDLSRPLACKTCCFPCCLQTMEVCSPPGQTVGRIEQQWSFWTPKFDIKGASGDVVLKIEGPLCTFSCCGDIEFKVLTADGSNQVGKISKRWGGYAREAYTDTDIFGISFPMDLDVRMKAVMLGACFLIDMMYFETSASKNQNQSQQQPQQQQMHQQQPMQPLQQQQPTHQQQQPQPGNNQQ